MGIFFNENLKYLRKKFRLTQGETAIALGLKRSTYANYESGYTEADYKTLENISEKWDISVEKLLFSDLSNVHLNKNEGEGNKGQNVHLNVHPSVHLTGKREEISQIQQLPAIVSEPSLQYGFPRVITVDVSGNEKIPYVPVRARAGYLLGYGDVGFMETLPVYSLPGFNNATHRIFEIEGNSMFNTFHDRDRVITRWDAVSGIRDGYCYVIVTRSDGILVKRIINRYKEGKLICKSDNQARGEYPPVIIDVHDVVEVWYCVEKLTRQLGEPGEMYKRVLDLEADVAMMKNALFSQKNK